MSAPDSPGASAGDAGASGSGRGGLRRRVTIWLFALSSIPAIALSAAAVLVLDELIEDELDSRADEIASSTRNLIDAELARAQQELALFLASEEMRRVVLDPLEAGAPVDHAQVERLLDRASKSANFELLALAAADDGPPSILASAHYPASIEAPAPPFAALVAAGTSTAGFAHELVAGNPPPWAPALVAVQNLALGGGRGSLVAYGGYRLDTHRLESIASTGRAKLVLESDGLRPRSFPSNADTSGVDGTGTAILLSPLPGGQARPPGSSAGAATASERPTPAKISIRIDARRLLRARETFTSVAAGLAALWLVFAPLAGALFSRPITGPIVELSVAAQRIGAGDLDVKITPRSGDEVGQLVLVFNRMTAELAESKVRLQRAERVAAWREIARRVAHEIKNPLFPIQMSVETLRKSFRTQHPKLEEIVEESTRTVLEEVRALNRIVTEFSDFARLPQPKLEPVSATELLAHVASLFGEAHSAREQAVRIVLGPPPPGDLGLPAVAGDREQLSRALINLVKNAVEAMPGEGGVVTLHAEREPRGARDGVRLSVADNGSGIPPDVEEKIFTPYFTTKAQGTGLGLAIVERIVQEHQGTIDVDSTPGQGTTFRIWLPAAVV